METMSIFELIIRWSMIIGVCGAFVGCTYLVVKIEQKMREKESKKYITTPIHND